MQPRPVCSKEVEYSATNATFRSGHLHDAVCRAVRQRIDAGFKEEQKANREAEAKRAEAELDHRARTAYFAVNPDASESAYKAIEADLKKQIQIDNALDQDRNRARLHSIYTEF